MKLRTVPITLVTFACAAAWSIIVVGENHDRPNSINSSGLSSQHSESVHKAVLTERARSENFNGNYGYTQVKAIPRYGNSANSHEDKTLVPDGLRLNINSYKVRGYHTAHLSWRGANSPSVVIYRDGQMIVVTDNDGDFVDDLNSRSKGVIYSYRICELDTNDCSENVLSAF